VSLAGELRSPINQSVISFPPRFLRTSYVTILETRVMPKGKVLEEILPIYFMKVIFRDTGKGINQLHLQILRYMCTGTNLSQFLDSNPTLTTVIKFCHSFIQS
jgi:hypothetical protein